MGLILKIKDHDLDQSIPFKVEIEDKGSTKNVSPVIGLVSLPSARYGI